MSCAAFSRPCSRSPCAAWIATLPNTAIAPVAEIASARVRPARSSITATCGTALMIRGASARTSASVATSGSGSSSSSAATRKTIPRIASFGAASRIAVAPARHTSPASASLSRPTPPPSPAVRSPGAVTAGGRRERISRSGLSTATIAASMPPPTATTTLCALTTRSEPTAKAEER